MDHEKLFFLNRDVVKDVSYCQGDHKKWCSFLSLQNCSFLVLIWLLQLFRWWWAQLLCYALSGDGGGGGGAPKPRCQRQRGQEISNFEQKWNSCLSRRRCEEACMNIWMESLENARSCESPGSVSSIVVTTAKFCRALSEPTASRHKPNQGNLVTNLVDLKKKIIQKWSQVTVLTLCQWINCAVRFCFLCQSKNRDWKTFQMFILFDSQMLSSPLNIGLGNSVSIFSEACLWWNIFSFDIQMFEYLARVAWALPTLASQIAYIDPDRGHRVKITSSLSSF